MLVIAPAIGHAQAWMPAGDGGLRLAVEQLVDDGVLDIPILSWPISRHELELATSIARQQRLSDSRSEAALLQIEAALESPTREWSLAVGDPQELRGFEDAPRESGEAGLAWRWKGEGRLAGELHLSAVAAPDDNQPLRPDGSYLAASTGNWLWSAGWQDRWWGGGHDGSLQLSSNARPLFALSLDRETSTPFKSRWLGWLGRWTLGTFMGAQEGHRPDSNHSLLWGFRVAARPLPGLELSFTRNAQFCGDKPPCGLKTFWNVVAGNDNQGDNVRPEDEPGNQLATLEARWGGHLGSVPITAYVQRTGETIDNKFPRPLRNLNLVGLSTWGELPKGALWRAHLELSSTTCADFSSDAKLNCAYENDIFTAGYRYRGRSMGHSTDSDSRQWVIGLAASESGGRNWSASLRRAEINRVGGVPQVNHTLSTGPALWWVGEARVEQPVGRARVEVSVALERRTEELTNESRLEPRGYLRWTRAF